MTPALISKAREAFHRQLLVDNVLSVSRPTKEVKEKFKKTPFEYVASNADAGSYFSIRLSNALINRIAKKLGLRLEVVDKKKAGQTLGHAFEDACQSFISQTFIQLPHLRPGDWCVVKLKDRSGG